MKEWIKKFGLRIWGKVEDRLAAFVTVGIIAIASILCAIFWKWLTGKHTLEMYRGVWLLALLAAVGLPTLLWISITRLLQRRTYAKKLKDSKDIKMAISAWIKDLSPWAKTRHFYYSDVAKQVNVDPRRLKAHLEAVAADCGERIEIGKETFGFLPEGLEMQAGPNGPCGSYL